MASRNRPCNYCTEALELKEKIWHNDENGKKELEEIIKNMKEKNKNKKYDCILGLSGGIDSCYTAYLLSKYKVRMLAVHIDAGRKGDYELAAKYINVVRKRAA